MKKNIKTALYLKISLILFFKKFHEFFYLYSILMIFFFKLFDQLLLVLLPSIPKT